MGLIKEQNYSFVVEENVPIPDRIRGRECTIKYPIEIMKVGDSFLIPMRADGRYVHISGSFREWARRTGFEFSSRKLVNGIRVWRVK